MLLQGGVDWLTTVYDWHARMAEEMILWYEHEFYIVLHIC
jgi:hypothetical protein